MLRFLSFSILFFSFFWKTSHTCFAQSDQGDEYLANTINSRIPAVVQYYENDTHSVINLANFLGSLENDFTFEYNLTGEDSSSFQLATETGKLGFLTPPDFDYPVDLDYNNIYNVIIEFIALGDSISKASHEIQVIVTPRVEAAFIKPIEIGQGLDVSIKSSSLDISSDGKILAVGATADGKVRVFEKKNRLWAKVGSDISGDDQTAYLGRNVSLSSDGQTIAINGLFVTPAGYYSGLIRVLKYDGDEWVKLGQDLVGKRLYDPFGSNVKLSANGSFLITKGYRTAQINDNTEYVYTYALNGNEWQKLADSVLNENEWNDFEMSSDGRTVVLGGSGKLQIFRLNGSDWEQLGSTIIDENNASQFGSSVSISADGKVVAFGAPQKTPSTSGYSKESGLVRVYSFNETDWNQIGNDLLGEAADDWFGFDVSLSGDANLLVVSAPKNDNESPVIVKQYGKVQFYQFIENKYIKVGEDLQGVELGVDYLGMISSLSSDGGVLALRSGSLSGKVKVFNVANDMPLIISKSAVTFSEKQEGIVIDFQATLGGNQYDDGITYSIAGEDASSFELSSEGHLKFKSPPDFRDPGDEGSDNNYELTISALGNYGKISESFSVIVTPVVGYSPLRSTLHGPAILGMVDSNYLERSAEMNSKELVLGLSDRDGGYVFNYNGLIWNLSDKLNGIRSFKLSNSGKLLSYVSYNSKGNLATSPVMLKGLSSETEVHDFSTASDALGGLIFNENGKVFCHILVGDVIVYQYVSDQWVRKGEPIEDSGIFITRMNSDGSVIAYSTESNVKVFEYKDFQWTQIGSFDESSSDIDLNANGYVIAIGDAESQTLVRRGGEVKVYSYDGANWHQKGKTISGEANETFLGGSLSITADGSLLAIGSGEKNETYASIYSFQSGDWKAIEDSIPYEIANWTSNTLNTSQHPKVRISKDGSLLGLIDPRRDGRTQIYSLANYRPVLTSLSTAVVQEGGSSLAGSVDAVYYGNPDDGNFLYSVSGEDSPQIRIDEYNGDLSFVEAPIFDSPEDATPDNIYVFDVEVTNKNYLQYTTKKEHKIIVSPKSKSSIDLASRYRSDVNEEFNNRELISSISMSADGNKIAIGSKQQYYENSYAEGRVTLLSFDGSSWVKDYELVGERYGEGKGTSVDLNMDGTVLAFASRRSGVDILLNSSGNWKSMGGTIAAHDHSATDETGISLSADGYTIAIGCSGTPQNSWNHVGMIRVFSFQNGKWSQIGNSMSSNRSQYQEIEGFGAMVELSADGYTLAIGNAEEPDIIRIYTFDGNAWKANMKGLDLEEDLFGNSFSLSANGKIMTIGYTGNQTLGYSGQVKAFQLIDGEWEVLGQVITGTSNYAGMGEAVNISWDGTSLSTLTWGGESIFYSFDGAAWVENLAVELSGLEVLNEGSLAAMDAKAQTYVMGAKSVELFNGTRREGYSGIFKLNQESPNTRRLNIFVRPTEAGTIIAGQDYPVGETVLVEAFSNDGFEFLGWQESGEYVSRKSSYSFVIEDDRDLIARFIELDSIKTIVLVSDPPNGGLLEGEGNYILGELASARAFANDGYVFTSWTEADLKISSNSSYDFEIESNQTLVANFSRALGFDKIGYESFIVKPNPARDMVFVECPKTYEQDHLKFKLINISGQEYMVQSEYCDENCFSLKLKVNSGIYVLIAIDKSDRIVYSGKVVVSRN